MCMGAMTIIGNYNFDVYYQLLCYLTPLICMCSFENDENKLKIGLRCSLRPTDRPFAPSASIPSIDAVRSKIDEIWKAAMFATVSSVGIIKPIIEDMR